MDWDKWYNREKGVFMLDSREMGIGEWVSIENKCREAMVFVEMLWQT